MYKITLNNSLETKQLGELFAKEISDWKNNRAAKTVCLSGDLGAGKTTFAQGLLQGLGAKSPYTSPTFVIMKKYNTIFHFDAYRVKDSDIIDLGWQEIIGNKDNIIIVEWAERIKKIIPKNSLWINFKWVDKNIRELEFFQSLQKRK